MIFDGLKQAWLRKQFAQLEKRHGDPLLQWPQNLVVIVDQCHANLLDQLHANIHRLNIEKTAISWVQVLQSGEPQNAVLHGGNMFRIDEKKILKWTGGLNDENVKRLLEEDFDLQINVCHEPSPALTFFTTALKSKCKVGHPDHDSLTYDLAVNVPLTQPEALFNEIAKYLKILTS
ncbi:DUF6913 domain-containing protein [Nonlabens xiamenensis]|uniref:DUF6913 domain-containing protein n=1 Tax=Nonlabens xiamenensis TaxID=2341043 RepID=UPI000F60AA95|nr:hypothetical protein [Nonlabens xiamenensis]